MEKIIFRYLRQWKKIKKTHFKILLEVLNMNAPDLIIYCAGNHGYYRNDYGKNGLVGLKVQKQDIMLATLAHELRHKWQYKNDIKKFDLPCKSVEEIKVRLANGGEIKDITGRAEIMYYTSPSEVDAYGFSALYMFVLYGDIKGEWYPGVWDKAKNKIKERMLEIMVEERDMVNTLLNKMKMKDFCFN